MVSLHDLQEVVASGESVAMTNAYDTTMAELVDESPIEMILVGDSVAVTTLGYDGTDRVTIDEMIHHTKAVTRGVSDTFVVADLPFGTYTNPADATRNAVRLKKEGRADAVKLEGGHEISDAVAAIGDAGISVFGHIGVTPQTADAEDGLTVQATTAEGATALRDQAIALDEAGVSGIVLELVASEAASVVTDHTNAITLGIGAGPHCDGQVVTLHDVLGLKNVLPETVAGIQADIGSEITSHLTTFHEAVADGSFPGEDATPTMDPGEADNVPHE